MRWFIQVLTALIVLTSTPAYADIELSFPELRYTCSSGAIDIHLHEHSASSEVTAFNTLWVGEPVPWKDTILLDGNYPKKGKPLILKCTLRSGITYVVEIVGSWYPEKVVGDFYPEIKITAEDKVVLPTTTFSPCQTSRVAIGDCEKLWAVRIFLTETEEKYGRENKPAGIYASSSVHRATKGFTNAVKLR